MTKQLTKQVDVPRPRRRRAPTLTGPQKDLVLFPVLEQFMHRMEAKAIANHIQDLFGIEISRERVYRLVQEAVEHGYVRLFPPIERTLTQELRQYPNAQGKGDVRVVNAHGARANEHVAAIGAEMTYKLIRELTEQDSKRDTVDIALGLGRTTMMVVRELSALLAQNPLPIKLVVHAITPTFSLHSPLDTPVAAFSMLQKAVLNIEFVGIDGPAFVDVGDYPRISRHQQVREAMGRRSDVDIVITSFADSSDPHGFLREYLMRFGGGVKNLKTSQWAGDVHLCPYTATGSLQIEEGLRPVTLFELQDLVALAARRNKHVVMLCAPCSHCGNSKSRALLPLLREPSLRVWSHLVVDYQSAMELRGLKA